MSFPQEEDALRTMFDYYDTKKDGAIDSDEAVQLFVDAGAPSDPESAREFINLMDVTNTGSVTFDEFKQAG